MIGHSNSQVFFFFFFFFSFSFIGVSYRTIGKELLTRSQETHNQLLSYNVKQAIEKNYVYRILKAHFTSVSILIGKEYAVWVAQFARYSFKYIFCWIGSFEINIQNATSFIRYFEGCIKDLNNFPFEMDYFFLNVLHNTIFSLIYLSLSCNI